jgi:hypothetical protein
VGSDKSQVVPYHPFEVSAVGRSPRTLQKLLQAQVALFDSSRVLYSHVPVMPGLPLVAGFLLLAKGIGQNKSVLPSVLLEPPVGARSREGHPELVACGSVREIHGGAELVLAVARRRARPIGPRPEDARKPLVGESLLVVGAVG